MALALLRDEAESDDAVQGAYLAALEHRPRPLTFEWMRRVVRNQAFDTLRRERRKREVALERASETQQPAGPGFTEKLELHRVVVEAVQGLCEPEKQVIYLRYFDGLTPTQIAERLDTPVKTVKTRLGRALAHLRERLRRRYGEGSNGWTHALAATFGPGGRIALQTLGTATVAGGLGIMAKKIALVAVLLLVAAWGVSVWTPLRGRPARPKGGDVATPDVTVSLANDTVELEGAHAGASTRRVTAEPVGVDAPLAPASAKTGAVLDVEVLWSNRSPAPGVGVHLRRITRGLPYQSVDRVVSDADGRARFEGLPAGGYQVSADRHDDENTAEIELGVDDEQTVQFALVAGVDVEGVVLDRGGAPVANAGIWLSTGYGDWLGGSVVERSGADGRFRLSAVPAQQSIGAIAAGYSPSLLVDLEDLDTSALVRIELRMTTAGGALRGTVTGPDGQPLAGALVSAGAIADSVFGIAGKSTERWAPRTVETNEHGEYALRGLPVGALPLRVRAEGLPVGKAEVEIVAERTAVADLALVEGAGVEGIVRGLDGLPLANAVVRAFDTDLDRTFLQGGQFDYEDTFGYPAVRTDADGRYLLTAIPPGDVHLFATPTLSWEERRRGVPRAETVLHAEPGEMLTWNPEVTEGRVIEGIVTYRNDVPMPQVFISARNDRTGFAQSLVNDDEGRFRFLNMEDVPYVLGVQLWSKPEGAGPVEAEDVYPDRGLVHLVADFDAPSEAAPATVRGTIEDAGTRAAGSRTLSIQLESDRNFARVYNEMDGLHFVFPDVDPGRYRPVVLAGGTPAFVGEWFELSSGEDRDLGTLKTDPAGSLRILVPRTEETRDVVIRMFLRPPGVMSAFEVDLGRDDARLVENLSAGEVDVRAYGTGISWVQELATVKAGEVSELVITLAPAVPVPMEILWPENHALGGLAVQIDNELGETVWDVHQPNVAFLERPYKPSPQLALGRYTVTAKSDSGLWGSAQLDVTSLDPEKQSTLHLEIR